MNKKNAMKACWPFLVACAVAGTSPWWCGVEISFLLSAMGVWALLGGAAMIYSIHLYWQLCDSEEV